MKHYEVKRRFRFSAAVFVGLLLTAIMTTGCVGSRTADDSLTTEDVFEKVGPAIDSENLERGDADKLEKLYRLKEAGIEVGADDFVLYTSKSNVEADEIVLLRLSNTADTEIAKDRIIAHTENQKIKFRDYRPSEYRLVENHVLKHRGSFVLFAVSVQADQLEAEFDKALR